MKTLDNPPEAVAAVWMMLFSLGPKSPPRMGKFWANVLEQNLIVAKPTIAFPLSVYDGVYDIPRD